MNKDKYQINTKKVQKIITNRFDSKTINIDKNKKKLKDKLFSKETFLNKEKRTKPININNIYNKTNQIKSEFYNRDNRNKKYNEIIKNTKTINNESIKHAVTKSPVINQINYINSFNKIKINVNNNNNNNNKTLHQNYKKNITINNCNLYEQANIAGPMYTSNNYYDYNDENNNYFRNLNREKRKNLYNASNINKKLENNREKDINRINNTNCRIIDNSNGNIIIGDHNQSMQNKISGYRKLQNLNKGKNMINNNVNYKKIEPKSNEIYEYNNTKKIKKKEDLNFINNEKNFNFDRNNNFSINNDRKTMPIKIKNMTGCNFRKNNSTSTLYCSPKKIMNYKRTIDDNNTNYYNNANNKDIFEKINKNNFVYRKANRNDSCLRSRTHIKNLGSEFTNEKHYMNKSINKDINKEISFNSPNSQYFRRNERNSVSYINSVKSNNRISNQNNFNIDDSPQYKIDELYNRNIKEKSISTTIQNSEDELKSNTSTIKNSNKKYYYQNYINKENSDDNKKYNMSNISNKNKTNKIKQNQKNIIYGNNFNSFDKNCKEDKSNYNKNNSNNYYNKKINTSTISDFTSDKNQLIKDKLNDDGNFYNFEINNNMNSTTGFQHNLFNKINSKNLNKTLKEKKELTSNVIKRKKYNSSFNNEISNNENFFYMKDRINNNNNIPKNCNKLIFNRKLEIENSNIYQYNNDMEENNNNKSSNTSFFIKKKIDSSIRSSPKQNLNEFIQEIAPYKKYKLEKEHTIDFLSSNSKTKPDFYVKKSSSRIKNIKNNSIESTADGKKEIYFKKTSQIPTGLNNSKVISENNSPHILNSYLKINKVIYHKKNLKIGEFTTTPTEFKNIKNNIMDNSILNNSQISIPSSKINISNNGDGYNKDKNEETDIEINRRKYNNIKQEGENEYLIKDDTSYSLNELKEKIINNYCFYKKFYYYNIKKPINRLIYFEKYIKSKKTNKEENISDEHNNNSNNISNMSQNKNLENNNSFSISFNENKINKKKMKNQQENKESTENKEKLSDEKILNEQNIISDYDSKNNSEKNLELGISNDKNKISNIKKNDNEIKYIDCINFDLSEENEENIDKSSKQNLHIKNNANNLEEKMPIDEENLMIRNIKVNLNNNKNELYSNYMSNSTSKKIDKNINKKNDITEKISLLTKKLDNILKKKNENKEDDNENKIKSDEEEDDSRKNISKSQKRKKIKKSLTQKEFVLGCSKLNDFFNKKTDNKNIFINDKIEEEINDELNEDIEIKQKIYTYKLKKRNKLLEDEEENIKNDKSEDKNYNLQNILSLKKNSFEPKNNLLDNKVKSNLDNLLLNPETNIFNSDENPLISKSDKENKEMKIEEKITNQLNSLNINNLDNISGQLINILLNNKDENKSIDNMAKFINIIFEKIINENIDLGLYSKLCLKLNSLLLNEQIENNIGNIIMNEYNKINIKNINEEMAQNNYLRLNEFIIELISVGLIKIENLAIILDDLFEKYQNEKNKYIYLESIIYLFDSLNNLFSQNQKEKLNIINLYNKFQNNFNTCLKEENMNDKFKEKLIDLIEKKDKLFKKENKESNSQDNVSNKKNVENKENKELSDNKIIIIEDKKELEPNGNYSKTNNNFYISYNNKLNNQNIQEESNNNNNTINNKKRKSKKKSKSTEKRKINLIKEENNQNINDIIMMNKEEIEKDLDNYLLFLEKEGIKTKENIYEELNDLYNWKVIDNLIMNKNVKLEEIIKIYLAICKTKNDLNNNDIFKVSEYIKIIIEYYKNNLSKNQIEILHLNMIELFMFINDIVENNTNEINMHEIMGNLLYILLKNKLYYMKDLNNFIEKNKDTQINIAKVVKYAIIASGNCSKQYHNDFKYTKLFNNNEIFSFYITNELNDFKNK